MKRTDLYLMLGFVAILAVVEASGLNGDALFIFSFAGSLMALGWYFESRRSRPLSRVELIAANVWLWVRRIFGLLGGTAFVTVAGFILTSNGHSLTQRIVFGLITLLLGALCFWVAIVGRTYGLLGEDLAAHRENKRRYRWRF